MNGAASCTILWAMSGEIPTSTTVFSFLSPAEEDAYCRAGSREVVTMSRLMDDVGSEAREYYVDMIADAGLFRLPDGRTLRSALHRKGKTSQWWYHPLTFRNSEGEPTYAYLLMILAIVHEAVRRGIRSVHLVHPPHEVAAVLASYFTVTVEQASSRRSVFDLVRGLLGRGRFVMWALGAKLALLGHGRKQVDSMDVALQGYWDWSLYADDAKPDSLCDRYFGALPERLRQRGMQIGYWCWYDPRNRPGGAGRRGREILRPLAGRRDVLLLQSLLTIREILVAAFDFSALPVLWAAVRDDRFRNVFRRLGLDFFPLFAVPILRGGLSSGIPQCLLYELAASRAQALTHPRVTVRFQEHNPPSRAVYAAMNGTATRCWAMQHASYNRSKTYLAMHPEKEFAGADDGEAVPHPERVCAMGDLGRRLFLDCGYATEQVLATGSARYDHVRLEVAKDYVTDCSASRALRVLVASSLPARADIQLVQAAVMAVKDLPSQVALRLRQHPFDRMESQPSWCDLAPRLEMSTAALKEDLAWADLVLVSQSTVGEEAFLAGKPVWQVRFPHPDQSALAEVVAIPRFYTVQALCQALKVLLVTGRPVAPTADEIGRVYRQLFQPQDLEPSIAIADAIRAEYVD
jgi:surface carbohydrate biosynthesis protein (TIGR04326 family)